MEIEKKPHAIEFQTHIKKKKCPQCVQIVKDKMLTMKERNMVMMHKFEEINKKHAKKRVLKDCNSEEDPDTIKERLEDYEDKKKLEKKMKDKKDAIAERKEKKRLRTRAKPKIKKKPRNPNKPKSEEKKEELIPIPPPKRPDAEPVSDSEIDKLSFRALPRNAPTFHNRALHSLKVEVKEEEEGKQPLFLKFPHRHHHLYTTKSEKAALGPAEELDVREYVLRVRDERENKDYERKHKPLEDKQTFEEYKKYLIKLV